VRLGMKSSLAPNSKNSVGTNEKYKRAAATGQTRAGLGGYERDGTIQALDLKTGRR